METTKIKEGDHVVITGNATQDRFRGRHATVLRILPKGTMAECRVAGAPPGPGEAYPTFLLEDLVLESERTLEAKLADQLAAWLQRVAPRVRDECCYASLKITLQQPQSEDDGTLYLEARLEEEFTSDEIGGRLPGVRFQ